MGSVAAVGAALWAVLALSPVSSTTQPAATTQAAQPGQVTLDDLLDKVAASDEQREEVAQIIEVAAEARGAWVRDHWQERLDLVDRYMEAGAANDAAKVKELLPKLVDPIQQMPKSPAVWRQIESVLSPLQRAQAQTILTLANVGGPFGISQSLHQAAKRSMPEPLPANKRCLLCHTPHVQLKPAKSSR